MSRITVILTVVAVIGLHGFLLWSLLGESERPAVEVKTEVIQGVLLIAQAAPPKPPEKKKTITKKPPPPKPIVKKEIVQPVREVLTEPPTPEIAEQPIVPPPEEPPLQVEAETEIETEVEVEQVVTLPPTVDDAGHLNNPPPKYPRLSRRLGEEGEVILELTVLADGSVAEVEIKTSSGYPRLDKAALVAVKKWRYRPATRNGEAVAYRYQQPIQFSMK